MVRSCTELLRAADATPTWKSPNARERKAFALNAELMANPSLKATAAIGDCAGKYSSLYLVPVSDK